jgi:hypothetical protein
MVGITQRQHISLLVVEGEAWALLQAMKEARRRGFIRVQFKSDSQALVEAIRTKNDVFFEFSLLVGDIFFIMLYPAKIISRQIHEPLYFVRFV